MLHFFRHTGVSRLIGPQLVFSDNLHAVKYRGSGESYREAMGRIASALSEDEVHYQAFREILLDQRNMPAGRVQAAMGSTKIVTPYNCFVSGSIEDSFVDGHGSIMGRALEAASTMRMGGGIGYDFSGLRPRGSFIKTRQAKTGGPVTFMPIYDAVCLATSSAGDRRGAQMVVLRIDHPDIEEFVRCKQNENKLTGFNISVAVTDEFMRCLRDGRPFPLRFEGDVHKEVDAQALWETIMRSTWDWSEPGVLFIDTINRMNNLWYCETISATNPCGEQPLPPYGACLLGSWNLVKYLIKEGARFSFNWGQLAIDIPIVVRAMDNIIDRAIYPLFEQEKEAKSKRRMGLGVTGLANCIEALGFSYGSEGFLKLENDILQRICHGTYRASIELAREKGAFPLFDASQYLQGKFIKTLPLDIQDAIAEHGIRNSHLLSIAPTGTISLTADNVSSSVEPVFAYEFDRTIQEFDNIRIETVEDYGVRVLGVRGKTTANVTVQEHLAVLEVAYRHVDSAVSKTCNVGDDVSWSEFKQIYTTAWDTGCKGCTTYRAAGQRKGVLVVREAGPASVCSIDEATGRRECE